MVRHIRESQGKPNLDDGIIEATAHEVFTQSSLRPEVDDIPEVCVVCMCVVCMCVCVCVCMCVGVWVWVWVFISFCLSSILLSIALIFFFLVCFSCLFKQPLFIEASATGAFHGTSALFRLQSSPIGRGLHTQEEKKNGRDGDFLFLFLFFFPFLSHILCASEQCRSPDKQGEALASPASSPGRPRSPSVCFFFPPFKYCNFEVFVWFAQKFPSFSLICWFPSKILNLFGEWLLQLAERRGARPGQVHIRPKAIYRMQSGLFMLFFLSLLTLTKRLYTAHSIFFPVPHADLTKKKIEESLLEIPTPGNKVVSCMELIWIVHWFIFWKKKNFLKI